MRRAGVRIDRAALTAWAAAALEENGPADPRERYHPEARRKRPKNSGEKAVKQEEGS